VIGVRGAEFLPRLAKDKDKDKDEDKDEDKDTEKNDFDPVAACAEVDESLVRERRELLYSIEHLREIYSGPRRPLALFHYPPFRVGTNESAFTRVLESAGASHCLFGHLHTQAEWQRVFQGERNGVTYRLVSCDALEFTPLLVDEVEA
jgi:predicted phosphohydrolase